MTSPTAVDTDNVSLVSENIALQEQVNQLLSEKAAWALEQEQFSQEIASLKDALSIKTSSEEESGKKYNHLLSAYNALEQFNVEPADKKELYFSQMHSLRNENGKLKEQLTSTNDDLVDKHKKAVKIVQDELKDSKKKLSSASKTINGLTSQINDKKKIINSQNDKVKVLDMSISALENDKFSLTKEVIKRKEPENIIDQKEFSQFHENFVELQDKVCRNKDERTTNNHRRLLKKVSVGRVKDWGHVVNDIKYNYAGLSRKKQRVLKKLSESKDAAPTSSHLLTLIESEKREKEKLWDLYIDRMNTIDALNEELFDSQKELAQMKNENIFLQESVVVFGKRKRQDDDENTPPKKK
ncbi:hypothetical protein K501DRAFT_286611 [Backusella circina FSU 941]|nr:hypothetical protein K501DRAFT_286611 [Backusella circina FSU 941]